jgi:hypothetical protein
MLENTVPTTHEKIRVLASNGIAEGDLAVWLEYLREVCEARDTGRLVVALKEIVVDYSPSTHLLKRALDPLRERRLDVFASSQAANSA